MDNLKELCNNIKDIYKLDPYLYNEFNKWILNEYKQLQSIDMSYKYDIDEYKCEYKFIIYGLYLEFNNNLSINFSYDEYKNKFEGFIHIQQAGIYVSFDNDSTFETGNLHLLYRILSKINNYMKTFLEDQYKKYSDSDYLNKALSELLI